MCRQGSRRAGVSSSIRNDGSVEASYFHRNTKTRIGRVSSLLVGAAIALFLTSVVIQWNQEDSIAIDAKRDLILYELTDEGVRLSKPCICSESRRYFLDDAPTAPRPPPNSHVERIVRLMNHSAQLPITYLAPGTHIQESLVWHEEYVMGYGVNLFVSEFCGLHNGSHSFPEELEGWQWSRWNWFVGCYEEVIAGCWRALHCFGHIVVDVFSRSLALPDEVLRSALFIWPEEGRHHPAARLFELGLVTPLYIGKYQYVFAERAYFVTREDRRQRFFAPAAGLLKLRQASDSVWRLKDHAPEAAIFFNRKKFRRFGNAEAVVEFLVGHFPEPHWRLQNDVKSLVAGVRLFAGTMFVVAAHGSALTHVIFMKSGTGFCDVQNDDWSWYFLNLSRVFQVRPFLLSVPGGIRLYGTEPVTFPLDCAERVGRAAALVARDFHAKNG